MAFIDLDESHPQEEGTYEVKIVSSHSSRKLMAVWKKTLGFSILDDTLMPEEYIESWKKK